MKPLTTFAIGWMTCTVMACNRPMSPAASSDSGPTASEAKGRTLSALEPYRNGLTDDDRRQFYHLSEGGELIPLAVLQALERPRTVQDGQGDGLVPFTDNLERYGFIPDPVSEHNPFGLPVGMTAARSRLLDRIAIGFNCTACHVGELRKGGRRVRVDGAPNMLRLNDMFADISTELQATLAEMGRRERFLLAVARRARENDARLPTDRTTGDRLTSITTDLALARSTLDYLKAMPALKAVSVVKNGYGRVDAFGAARNLLFGGDPRNMRAMNAPVSFPHIWGIETTAWLQWGANTNSVMERNIGQSLGVGAVFDPKTFSTTSRFDNLNTLEHTMYKIVPPTWPIEVFGPIDQARADRGRGIYDRTCANCHEKPFERTPSGLVVYQLFSPAQLGESARVAENFDEPVFVEGKAVRFAAAAFNVLESLKRQYYAANNVSDATQAEWEGRARRTPPAWAPKLRSTLADANSYPDSKGGKVYPAKPLAGIWATAPYLINGSVANMWDLLTAPAARPRTFSLGSREYDTEKLGYRTTPDPEAPAPAWEFDTSDPANSNAGHVYGTTLPDEDKWALIEFLKVLGPGELQKAPIRR